MPTRQPMTDGPVYDGPTASTLVGLFEEVDRVKEGHALIYSTGDVPVISRCIVCGQSFQSHRSTDLHNGPALGSACLDCTTGDPFP